MKPADQFAAMVKMKAEMQRNMGKADLNQNNGMSQSQIKFAQMSNDIEKINSNLRKEQKFVRQLKKIGHQT